MIGKIWPGCVEETDGGRGGAKLVDLQVNAVLFLWDRILIFPKEEFILLG